MSERIFERDEQLDLLKAFLGSETYNTPNSILLHGNPSTGKSLTLKYYLETSQLKYSWIKCDECVSPKILWKRIIQSLKNDSGVVPSNKLTFDSQTTSSFQGFIKTFIDFFKEFKYKSIHYIVLDRVDQIMEGSDEVYVNFAKFQEVTQIFNISIIFVTSSIPRVLVTSSIPTIYFPNYTSDKITDILIKLPICQLPSELKVASHIEQSFWESYVRLTVDSFYTFTTDIVLLRRILKKLWDPFIDPVKNRDLAPNEFLSIYRKNSRLLSSEYAVSHKTEQTYDDEDEEDLNNQSSNLSTISKYILIAAYLASFNDPKQDWLLFSKLKEFHRRKKNVKPYKKAKMSSRLLEPSSFDLERLLAITHAIYSIDSVNKLPKNIDLITQIANLSTLKMLLKSNNQDYISAKTKWKVNATYDFIKSLSTELEFILDDYLVE